MNLDDLQSPEVDFESWSLHGLFGAPAVLFPSIGSTNQWAKANWTDLRHGTLVLADSQSQGRGRFTRIWRSPEGKNLYMSLVLKPENIPLTQWAHLTQIAAIVLAKEMILLGLDAHVKWPNDILCRKHKMCGILSERSIQGSSSALILGIGININSLEDDFAGLDRLASSLRLELGCSINRELFLKKYLSNLEQAFHQFESQGITPWLDEWRTMHNFFGSKARLVQTDFVRHGMIMGINDDGSLLFLPEGDSDPCTVYSGDLEV